jgi:cysteine synthase
MRADSILHTIGNTPHIKINRLFGNTHHVWIKSERSNPGGSIKDRIALSCIFHRNVLFADVDAHA